jgi:type II secretory pathway pseudopilin PulG
VSEQANQTERLAEPGSPRSRDAGMSYVELLVGIVLLGTVVVAVLTGVQSTIVASRINRDHSTATAWLQSASDVLYGVTRIDCGNAPITNEAAVIAAYNSIARSTPNSEGWPPDRISVTDVKFWNGSAFDISCQDDFAKTLQLISLSVTDESNAELETVKIVKGGNVAEASDAP